MPKNPASKKKQEDVEEPPSGEEEADGADESDEVEEAPKEKKEKKEKKDKKDKKEKKEKKANKELAEDDDDGDEGDAPAAEADAAEAATVEKKPILPPDDTPAHYKAEFMRLLEDGPFKPHSDSPEISGAVEVKYCPVDGLPPDFCQYGPDWEKCKPWCIQNAPHFYPELADGGVNLADAQKAADSAKSKDKVTQKPGGKVIRAKSPGISITKLSRGGRKCVTQVVGIDSFGIKPEDAAKIFKKTFACGSASVKGDAGVPDCVEIQGDFEEEVVDLLCKNFPAVIRDKCTFGAGGTKKGGKKK